MQKPLSFKIAFTTLLLFACNCGAEPTGLLDGGAAENRQAKNAIFDTESTWKDDSGKDVRLSLWRDKFVVLTMSYTRCRRTCPLLTMAKLKEISTTLRACGIDGAIVVVTFDPENDHPKELATFRADHHFEDPNWHFLTGSISDTKKLADKLGLNGFFQMDDHIVHDFRILLFNPSGQSQVLDWHHRDVSDVIGHLAPAPAPCLKPTQQMQH